MRRGFTRTYYRGEGVYVCEKESERQRTNFKNAKSIFIVLFVVVWLNGGCQGIN